MGRTRIGPATVSAICMLAAGMAGHWLITPVKHPDAATAQYVTAWCVVIVGLVLAVREGRRSRGVNAS